MTIRLETVDAGIVRLLNALEPEKARKVALSAALLAVEATSLRDARIDSALTAVRAGRFGESPERAAVQALIESLDEEQWMLQERLEKGSARETEHLAAFSRARACHAVWYALDSDPRLAALETVYEAYASGANLRELTTMIAEQPSDSSQR